MSTLLEHSFQFAFLFLQKRVIFDSVPSLQYACSFTHRTGPVPKNTAHSLWQQRLPRPRLITSDLLVTSLKTVTHKPRSQLLADVIKEGPSADRGHSSSDAFTQIIDVDSKEKP